MVKFNREKLRDKVYACWIGKNIGGTMGTPYEGRTEMQDISGFATKSGAPLPNDDLDLQLIWLKAMREVGPEKLNSKILSEYWIDLITPFWNEYGVSKSNLRGGLIAPLCGEYNNPWKDSNGAWIRTEVWACLTPALPEKTIRFSYEDASVDHGMGEGTYAAIFVAAIESAAFVINDIRTLLEIGLSKIPPECRVYKSVKIAIDAYDSGKDYKEARKLVVDDILKDLGWFQAPANVAFVVIGMLYGEGDFKKSMIIAINCGDDTDCTGATIGSIFGIMNGTAGIPKDWQEHIGDEIITISVNRGACYVPRTCSELTDWVMQTIPSTIKFSSVVLHDGEDDFSEVTKESFMGADFANSLGKRSRYSFTESFTYANALVEYDRAPDIAPNGEIGVKVTLYNQTPCQKIIKLRWLLPDGFTVSEGKKAISLHTATRYTASSESVSFKINAGEKVEAVNRLYLEVTCEGRPTVGMLPIVLLG